MTPTTRAPKPAPGAIAVFVGRPGRGFEGRYEAVAYSGNFEIMGTLGERESGGETNARRIANLARVAIESWGRSGDQHLELYVDSLVAVRKLQDEHGERGEAIHIHHISESDNVVRQLPPFIGTRTQVPNRIDWLPPLGYSGR